MALSGYTMENLAQGNLLFAISPSANSLTLQAGQGALFPATGPFLIKVEQFSGGNVVKREMIKITSRSGDVLTMGTNRAFEECPLAYNSVAQQQVAQSFAIGDVVSQVVTAGHMAEIQTEIGTLTPKTDIQTQSYVYASDTGALNAFVITPSPSIGAYSLGMRFSFKASTSNTGPCTLKVGTGPVVNLKKPSSTNLVAGEIVTDQIVEATYNGTEWVMTSQPTAVVAQTGGLFISTEAGENMTLTAPAIPVFLAASQEKTYQTVIDLYGSSINFGNANAARRLAVYFTTPTELSTILSEFTVYLRRQGNPTDNLVFSLLDATKTTTIATLATVPAATLKTTDYGTFPFTPVTLRVPTTVSNATKYYLQISRSGAADATNYYVISSTGAATLASYGYATYSSDTESWSADVENNDPSVFIQYSHSFTAGRAYMSRYQAPGIARVDGLVLTGLSAGDTVLVYNEGKLSLTRAVSDTYYYPSLTAGQVSANGGAGLPVLYAYSSGIANILGDNIGKYSPHIATASLNGTANATLTVDQNLRKYARGNFITHNSIARLQGQISEHAYQSIAQGTAARSITPASANFVYIVHVYGTADLRNWTMSFAGFGASGGFNGHSGGYPGATTLGLQHADNVGTGYSVFRFSVANEVVGCGSGGNGQNGQGGSGGTGGGCVIFKVYGKVIMDYTTFFSIYGGGGAQSGGGAGSALVKGYDIEGMPTVRSESGDTSNVAASGDSVVQYGAASDGGGAHGMFAAIEGYFNP